MVARYGQSLDGAHKVTSSYTFLVEMLRPCFKIDAACSRRIDDPYYLDDAKVAAFAKKQAEMIVSAWRSKIIAKMGELEDATAHYVGNYSFTITGTKNGKHVRIDQSMIINLSSKNKLFNQYPARIYVDGHFTSAAKFKKEMGA